MTLRNLSSAIAGFLTALFILGGATALAANIQIDGPYAHAMPDGATTGAAYMQIRNTGLGEDRLTGGAASVAKLVQVHEMTMDGAIMRMGEVKGGIAIPAGGAVELHPGGYHIMLIGLQHPMRPGDRFPLTLHFRKAGAVTVQVTVRSAGE